MIRSQEFGRLALLKGRMLCHGVRASDECRSILRHQFSFDEGFIHGAVVVLEDNVLVNTAIVEDMPLAVNAPELIYSAGVWSISDETTGLKSVCSPLRQPQAINQDVLGLGLVSNYLRLHSERVLFCVPIRQCVFGAIDAACKFCTYERRKVQYPNIDLLVEVVGSIVKEVGSDIEFAIGGGTPVLSDWGASYYSDFCEKIDSLYNLPMSIEMMPPPAQYLKRFQRAGVRSLITSIEIWNDNLRRELCPGKAQVSKLEYLQCWREAIDVLGKGSVSSVLLAGLEPECDTKSGIDVMIALGVIPTIIPFRPYGSSELGHLPCASVESYMRLASYCALQLKSSGLKASTQIGCTKCGACSLEVTMEASTYERCMESEKNLPSSVRAEASLLSIADVPITQ